MTLHSLHVSMGLVFPQEPAANASQTLLLCLIVCFSGRFTCSDGMLLLDRKLPILNARMLVFALVSFLSLLALRGENSKRAVVAERLLTARLFLDYPIISLNHFYIFWRCNRETPGTSFGVDCGATKDQEGGPKQTGRRLLVSVNQLICDFFF